MLQYLGKYEWTQLIEPLCGAKSLNKNSHSAIMNKLTHQWVAAVTPGASRPNGSNLEFTLLLKVTWQHSTADYLSLASLFTNEATAAHI